MRRCLARVLAFLCTAMLAATLVGAATPSNADDRASGPDRTDRSDASAFSRSRTADPVTDRDLSLELRDLFLAQDRLSFLAAARARLLLARPTDGKADPGGDGYRGRSSRRCAENVCVHFARRGRDAPRSRRWVRRTVRVAQSVWDHEVGDLGFRRPPGDGRRGGDDRFDFYLADIGARGLFGYCAPERRVPGQRFTASSYCVLDDDFAREQYGVPPRRSLRVTTAHEFFHAVQFGYDFREDPWLMETTAVWMEESFADGANDSRRYLRYGNVRRPGVPLDTYSNSGLAQYGNWPFWEFATKRHGEHLVRAVWRRADARRGAPDQSSIRALAHVLDRRSGETGTLRRTLANYAAVNLDPELAYPEGRHWPSARVANRVEVDRVDQRGRWRPRVDHLSARHLALRPATRASGRPLRRTKRWRLELAVAAPRRAAVVLTLIRPDGSRDRTVDLDRRRTFVRRFDGRRVAAVVVTAVNASTRSRCDRQTLWACGGVPRDDNARFSVRYRVSRAPR